MDISMSISHTADRVLSCIQADSVQAPGHTLVSTVSEDIIGNHHLV